MIALIFLFPFCSISVSILALSLSTSMFQVTGSLSTSTGTQPQRTTAAAQEMMVKVGMTTSSPGWSFKAATAASRATVPLQTAIPCRRPAAWAMRSSNRLTNGPSEEIQPVSMHSLRYFLSLPSSKGSLTGIIRYLTSIINTHQVFNNCREPRFVLVSSVRALLHLDHLHFFQHVKAVPAGGEQDGIAV